MTTRLRLDGRAWVSTMRVSLLVAVMSLALLTSSVSAYTTIGGRAATTSRPFAMSTTVAPPEVETERRTRTNTDTDTKRRRYADETTDDSSLGWGRRDGDLEYLEDEWASRLPEDPFHILLLQKTFEKDKITINYVSGSVAYVTGMPQDEAHELSAFAAVNGMSCLGTWTREECLRLGNQLQVRDIVCRVVPFVEGGQRGWQAKGAGEGSGSAADVPNFSGGNFD